MDGATGATGAAGAAGAAGATGATGPAGGPPPSPNSADEANTIATLRITAGQGTPASLANASFDVIAYSYGAEFATLAGGAGGGGRPALHSVFLTLRPTNASSGFVSALLLGSSIGEMSLFLPGGAAPQFPLARFSLVTVSNVTEDLPTDPSEVHLDSYEFRIGALELNHTGATNTRTTASYDLRDNRATCTGACCPRNSTLGPYWVNAIPTTAPAATLVQDFAVSDLSASIGAGGGVGPANPPTYQFSADFEPSSVCGFGRSALNVPSSNTSFNVGVRLGNGTVSTSAATTWQIGCQLYVTAVRFTGGDSGPIEHVTMAAGELILTERQIDPSSGAILGTQRTPWSFRSNSSVTTCF